MRCIINNLINNLMCIPLTKWIITLAKMPARLMHILPVIWAIYVYTYIYICICIWVIKCKHLHSFAHVMHPQLEMFFPLNLLHVWRVFLYSWFIDVFSLALWCFKAVWICLDMLCMFAWNTNPLNIHFNSCLSPSPIARVSSGIFVCEHRHRCTGWFSCTLW